MNEKRTKGDYYKGQRPKASLSLRDGPVTQTRALAEPSQNFRSARCLLSKWALYCSESGVLSSKSIRLRLSSES